MCTEGDTATDKASPASSACGDSYVTEIVVKLRQYSIIESGFIVNPDLVRFSDNVHSSKDLCDLRRINKQKTLALRNL